MKRLRWDEESEDKVDILIASPSFTFGRKWVKTCLKKVLSE
jgi:hypothetical protein